MTTNAAVSSNSPIEIDGSGSTSKDRALNLNSKSISNGGSISSNVSIASENIVTSNNTKVVTIAATDVTFDGSTSNVVHIGKGYNKTNFGSDRVTIGGSLAVRGIDDDTTTQYNQSDWVTSQTRLRTSNALINDLAQIPWVDDVLGCEVIQVKAHILSSSVDDASRIYSAEISGVYSIDNELNLHEIGTPIILEWSSYSPDEQPTVEIGSDAAGVNIKAQGIGTETIQWLCSYSYHRLINLVV